MKSIERLISFLTFFGWLSVVGAPLFLAITIFTSRIYLLPELTAIQTLMSGLVYLLLAHSLSKKEKWAWCTGFFVFVVALSSNIIIQLLLSGNLTAALLPLFFYTFFLYLLIRGRRDYIRQAKERNLRWFHNLYFVIIVAGVIVQQLIAVIMISHIFKYIQ